MMCKRTVCVSGSNIGVSVAKPCPMNAEGATLLRGVQGFSPGKF